MKNYAEKEKLIEKFIKVNETIAIEALTASTDEQKEKVAQKLLDATLPLQQMYVDEIQSAINPVNNITASVILAALKVVTKAMENQYPKAVGLSNNFVAITDVETVAMPKELYEKCRNKRITNGGTK